MESEQFTVSFDLATESYAICDASGAVVERRVTPNGTIAELMDLGLSQEKAAIQVLEASKSAWQGK